MCADACATFSSSPFEGVSVILLSPRPAAGLWDAELGARVERLEDQLDGAHVTVATPDGPGPRLGDALRAAEFLGSRTAVVVVPRSLAPWSWQETARRLAVHVVRAERDEDLPRLIAVALAAQAA